METIDLTKKSLVELKSLAYDTLVVLQNIQSNLKTINEEIEKRIKFTESRKSNGKLGGRPIKDNNLTITDRLSKTEPKNNLPENENENKDIVDREEIEIGVNCGSLCSMESVT